MLICLLLETACSGLHAISSSLHHVCEIFYNIFLEPLTRICSDTNNPQCRVTRSAVNLAVLKDLNSHCSLLFSSRALGLCPSVTPLGPCRPIDLWQVAMTLSTVSCTAYQKHRPTSTATDVGPISNIATPYPRRMDRGCCMAAEIDRC